MGLDIICVVENILITFHDDLGSMVRHVGVTPSRGQAKIELFAFWVISKSFAIYQPTLYYHVFILLCSFLHHRWSLLVNISYTILANFVWITIGLGSSGVVFGC